jgi:formylglycine-generating enzyme required for sulfatase activity
MENSFRMKIVPLPGTEVPFSARETRERDFTVLVEATGYDATKGTWILGTDCWKQVYGSWKDPGFDRTGERPVVCVNRNTAQTFCEWRLLKARKEGRIGQEFRQPTDHEWSCVVGIGHQKNPDQTTQHPGESSRSTVSTGHRSGSSQLR